MTFTMNTLPQEQLAQQINDSIFSLNTLMEKNPDLTSDVLPFMQGTFAKLKQLVGYKLSFEQSYEILQIATNYLPKALHSYCGLPIEYRNKKPIKANKTARDLLIGDLKILKKQVYEFENTLFSELEQSMRVNSNVIKEKFSTQMQLATQVESSNDDNFINQFDIEKFKSNESYSSLFVKEVEERKPLTQAISSVMNTGNDLTRVAKGFSSKLSEFYSHHAKSVSDFFSWICFIAIIIAAPTAIYFGCSYLNREISLNSDSINHTTSMYHVMENNVLSASQVKELSQKDYNDLINGSIFRKSMVSYQTNGNIITVLLKDIPTKYCETMVDSHDTDFVNSTMKINNIALPEQHIISDKYYLRNNNHKLCYLEENNIQLTLDSAHIYKNHSLQVNHDVAWKNVQNEIIAKDKMTIDQLLKEYKDNSKRLWYYEQFDKQLKQYQENIK